MNPGPTKSRGENYLSSPLARLLLLLASPRLARTLSNFSRCGKINASFDAQARARETKEELQERSRPLCFFRVLCSAPRAAAAADAAEEGNNGGESFCSRRGDFVG